MKRVHLEELKAAFGSVIKKKGEDQTGEKEEGTVEEILKDYRGTTGETSYG